MPPKLTSKKLLTLPKSVTAPSDASEYFEAEGRAGQISLTPTRIQRGDAARAKMAGLELTEADMTDAVAWSRQRH